MTYKEAITQFKNHCFSMGYYNKVLGDDAYYRDNLDDFIKIISVINDRIFLYKTNKGNYYLDDHNRGTVDRS